MTGTKVPFCMCHICPALIIICINAQYNVSLSFYIKQETAGRALLVENFGELIERQHIAFFEFILNTVWKIFPQIIHKLN